MSKENETSDKQQKGDDFIADVIHSCSNCKLFNADKKICEHDPCGTTIWYDEENEGTETLENNCVRFEIT